MLLEIRDLEVVYRSAHGNLRAVAGVSLAVETGTSVGLVGESGSGKSTLARAVIGLVPVASGAVLLDGVDILSLGRRGFERVRQRVQLVFQDPYSSLNPRMTIGEILEEAIARHHRMTRSARRAEVHSLLELVGLSRADELLYPAQFSGGQRQRVAIARALAVRPELIIADEITASLDVSIQASILNLLRDVQAARDVSYLFISHNLGVVRWASRRVAVMHLGKIVEAGETEAVFRAPRHPYTRALVDAIPRLGGGVRPRLTLEGDVPDPHAPPSGCRFHTRCPVGPLARPERVICTTDEPDVRAATNPNAAACHFPLPDEVGRDAVLEPAARTAALK
jgi:peptide/nickel transport system ATP-binding protein